MAVALPILNLNEATFECIFGRGCDGKCCQNGRPSVSAAEQRSIKKVMKRTLPLLRPEARELIEKEGYLSKRMKLGQPMVRVLDGWCVFFNKGCVLHQLGIEDGESYQYKPIQCALFPVEHHKGEWYIRQWDYKDEDWDLFCLNPKQSKLPAAKSLNAEIELAEKAVADGRI